jgi:hypothetical protein
MRLIEDLPVPSETRSTNPLGADVSEEGRQAVITSLESLSNDGQALANNKAGSNKTRSSSPISNQGVPFPSFSKSAAPINGQSQEISNSPNLKDPKLTKIPRPASNISATPSQEKLGEDPQRDILTTEKPITKDGSPQSADPDAADSSSIKIPDESDMILSESVLDWDGMIYELHMLFLLDSQKTRIAAMEWLMMIHKKVPNKVSSVGLSHVSILKLLPRLTLSTRCFLHCLPSYLIHPMKSSQQT